MTTTRGADGRRGARVLATLTAVALVAVAVVAIGLGLRSQRPSPPGPPDLSGRAAPTVASGAAGPASPSPSGAASAAPDTPPDKGTDTAPRGLPDLGWSRPVQVDIPTLGVSSRLEDLALDSAGVMEVPQDPALAGWFTPAPPPGTTGVSVIAGHVTWDQEPAVFFRLGELRPGDRVTVDRADGVTAVFEVTRIGEFAKDAFPTEQVYQAVDSPSLRLITCGGQYDEATARYLSNVIVWADLVEVRR